MEALSLEIQVMILEQVRSLAEVCTLRRVCRPWATAVEFGWQGWLRKHDVGTSTPTFSRTEVGFAMKMVAESGLDRSGRRTRAGTEVLSLTCELNGKSVVFCLTRESGQVPECKFPLSCGCSRTKFSHEQLRQPYVVVKEWRGDGSGCVVRIGPLRAGLVRVLLDRVVPVYVTAVTAGKGTREVQRVLRAMCLGGFRSARRDCKCCSGRNFVCASCEPPDWERVDDPWITCSSFKEARSRGGDDWFRGVTDAAGVVKQSRHLWLMCVQASRQVERDRQESRGSATQK